MSKVCARPAAWIRDSASGDASIVVASATRHVAPKTSKQRRQNRADPSNRKGRVASIGCILCRLLGRPQCGKTDLHHIREGQGGSMRAGDRLIVPLCHNGCHQGPHGVHGDRSLLRLAKVDELALLDATLFELEKAVML